MRIKVFGITHPKWSRVYLKINGKTFTWQILEELQKKYPYFNPIYIEKMLKEFLTENEELSNYVDRPTLDISLECNEWEMNTLANKLRDNFKRMLKYLDEKHPLVAKILEDEGELL